MCAEDKGTTGPLMGLTDTALPSFRTCHTEGQENPLLPLQPLSPTRSTATQRRRTYTTHHTSPPRSTEPAAQQNNQTRRPHLSLPACNRSIRNMENPCGRRQPSYYGGCQPTEGKKGHHHHTTAAIHEHPEGYPQDRHGQLIKRTLTPCYPYKT
ncbi:Hypothetical predicted protein, partial [Pelobates cultripes]